MFSITKAVSTKIAGCQYVYARALTSYAQHFVTFTLTPWRFMKLDKLWIAPSIAMGGFVLGLEVATAAIQARDKWGDSATWAGAAGTLAAFIATVWVATGQSRQRTLEAHNRAVLCVAKHLPQMRRCLGKLDEGCRSLEVLTNTGQLSTYNHPVLIILNACEWKVDDLEPLAVLPHDAAYRLACVRADLSSAHQKLHDDMLLHARRDLATDQVIFDVAQSVVAIQKFCEDVRVVRGSLAIAITESDRILPRLRHDRSTPLVE
jgi:hypothetical protein